jgi:hypothetical protein
MSFISIKRCTIAIASLTCIATTHAARFDGAHLSQQYPIVVEVKSNSGQQYDHFVDNGPQIGAQIWGHCTNSNELWSGEVSADGWSGDPSIVNFSIPPHATEAPPTATSVPDGIYPAGVSYPQAWKKRAIDACNVNLGLQKAAKGWTTGQVLSKPWEVNNVFLTTLHGKLLCAPDDPKPKPWVNFNSAGAVHYETEIPIKMTVKCARYLENDFKAKPKGPPVGAKDLKLKIGVNQASLIMVPATYQGVCPAELNASATIVTNGVTDVKYRLESDKGQLSPVATIHVDQTNTAYVSIPIKIGQPAQSGGFEATPTQGGNAQNTFANVQGASNVHQGFYRLRIVSPNTVNSAPANFKVTCAPAAATNFNANPSPAPGNTGGGMLKQPSPNKTLRQAP